MRLARSWLKKTCFFQSIKKILDEDTLIVIGVKKGKLLTVGEKIKGPKLEFGGS